MKTFFVLAFIVVFFSSCGRRDNNNCRNKESMRIECRAVNQPTYGYQYSQEMCDRSYNSDRCY